MNWPWSRPKRPSQETEAEQAVVRAKEALEEIRLQRVEVREASTRLLGLRSRNHFGDQLTALIEHGRHH